jgi:hypothetical protein
MHSFHETATFDVAQKWRAPSQAQVLKLTFPDYQELYGLVARLVKLPSTACEPCVRVLLLSKRIQKMASAAPFTLSPAAASSSGALNQKSRGPGFKKEHDLKLAKAWVRASREGANTDMSQFWNTVAKYLNADAWESQGKVFLFHSISLDYVAADCAEYSHSAQFRLGKYPLWNKS